MAKPKLTPEEEHDKNSEKELDKLLTKFNYHKNKLDKIGQELLMYDIENKMELVGCCFSEFSTLTYYRIEYIDEYANFRGTKIIDDEFDNSFLLEHDAVISYDENDSEIQPNEISNKEFNDILKERLESFMFTNIKGDDDYDFGLEGGEDVDEDGDLDDE